MREMDVRNKEAKIERNSGWILSGTVHALRELAEMVISTLKSRETMVPVGPLDYPDMLFIKSALKIV